MEAYSFPICCARDGPSVWTPNLQSAYTVSVYAYVYIYIAIAIDIDIYMYTYMKTRAHGKLQPREFTCQKGLNDSKRV